MFNCLDLVSCSLVNSYWSIISDFSKDPDGLSYQIINKNDMILMFAFPYTTRKLFRKQNTRCATLLYLIKIYGNGSTAS